VTVEEAEFLVENPIQPYPEYIGKEKYVVRGQSAAGGYLQVIYIFSPKGVVFVIHARPLADREKRALRRRRRT